MIKGEQGTLACASQLLYQHVSGFRARALQDFSYALVKAEMDTDFEEECKEIVERREVAYRFVTMHTAVITLINLK